MKGENRGKPKAGRTKHKGRARSKYVSQWGRTSKNKLNRAKRQARRFNDFVGLRALEG